MINAGNISRFFQLSPPLDRMLEYQVFDCSSFLAEPEKNLPYFTCLVVISPCTISILTRFIISIIFPPTEKIGALPVLIDFVTETEIEAQIHCPFTSKNTTLNLQFSGLLFVIIQLNIEMRSSTYI